MQIETRLSDQLAQYLDLAVERNQTDCRQHGQHRHSRIPHARDSISKQRCTRRSGCWMGRELQPVHVKDVDGLISRPDGNNVSMDREGLHMAEAQLKFRTGVALMRLENQRVMDAIHADK